MCSWLCWGVFYPFDPCDVPLFGNIVLSINHKTLILFKHRLVVFLFAVDVFLWWFHPITLPIFRVMAILINLAEMWTRVIFSCIICALAKEAFLERFLISFGESNLTFFLFECSIFTQEKQRFLEHQINPMTYETLGDLVEDSLDLEFD